MHTITQNRYDRLSRIYNLLTGGWEDKLRSDGIKLLGCLSGKTVLEIGSGTGKALPLLAKATTHEGKVVGLDLSSGMIALAQSLSHQIEDAGRVHLSLGDACYIPLQNNQIDAIFIGFTLELFTEDEIPIVLAECWRVLRSEGRLGVVALSKYGKKNIVRNFYEWLHHVIPQWVDCQPIYVEQSLITAGFYISSAIHKTLFGLPVDIICGIKPS